MNTEATRIGKEKKKAAAALYELLGVKVISVLATFNGVEMLRITAPNDYDGLKALVVNYWDVVHPLANAWSITRDVAGANLGFPYSGMSYTEQVRYLHGHSYNQAGEAQETEVTQMFMLKLNSLGTHHLNSAGARYNGGQCKGMIN